MEMDQSEAAEVTPNINNWKIINSQTHTDQDIAMISKMERYTFNTFRTPHVCRSGDSGFHSDITPDSIESVHNFTNPSQPSGSHNKITQDDLLNFQPFLAVNSTPNPGNCLEMMETSMYAEDERMEVMKQLMQNEIDDFNTNDIDESNVMISKDEKSTNISLLYTNLNTLSSGNNYYNSDKVEEISTGSESFHKFSDIPTLDSNVQVKKISAFKKCSTITPSIVHSPDKRTCVRKFVEESTNQVKEENNLNFSHTSLEYVLQNINSLPPLLSPIKQNLRSTTERKLSKRRYLNGIERLDILYFLGIKGNFLNIVSKIFGYLSPYDLMNIRNVSVRWSKIVNMAPATKILKEFKKQQNEQKENVSESQESSFELKHRRTPGRQTYLSAIQNTTFLQPQRASGSPHLSPTVSPTKMRFHLYQKEGQKLKQGERLLRCPKCMCPSHDPGSTYATCTRVGCKYEFCIFCRNEYLANHHCPPFYTPRLCKRTITIGSKGSKRNLRRL